MVLEEVAIRSHVAARRLPTAMTVSEHWDFVVQPLYHPPVSEITVQGILHALSDPARVRIFVQLAAAECPKNCSVFGNIGDTPMPKSSLSQHFKILREAGLIRSERKGVELQNRTRCAELEDKFGALVDAIIEAYKNESKKPRSDS